MKKLFSWLTKVQLKLKRRASENESTVMPNIKGISKELTIKEHIFPFKHIVIDNF